MALPSERGRDLGQKFIAHDAVAKVDGSGETRGIGSTVAFDDDTVEPEEYAAVGAPRIHTMSQLPERRAREQIWCVRWKEASTPWLASGAS